VIEVRKLSKYFGFTKAVQELSFTVEWGEVLGFLGPNGAGKTTTMKMLTCYLPPSSGSATVLGYDILTDSMEVRRRIGYLPEKNPLYHDMRVDGYLSFVARLKRVEPAAVGGAVGHAIERCGLAVVRRATIGLDPRQIVDIRKLIRELGENRTVILSSHILPEVSQVCDRIIIINRGRLVAVDTPENLRDRLRRASMTRVRLRSAAAREQAEELIRSIGGVLLVRGEGSADDGAVLVVESAPDRDLREEIARRLVGAGLPLLEIYNEELSLEDIFIRLVTEEEH